MSNAASEAAAALVPDIATELIAKSTPSDLAQSSLVEEVQAVAAEQNVPSSQPEPVATDVAEDGTEDEPFELPSFELVELDDDLEPDDDELLPAATVDDEEGFLEYEDPDELRARLTAAEKKAKHYEKQALEARQGQWRKKYKEMYPLANIDEIHATSRRQFERQAILSHNQNYKHLQPLIESLNRKAEALKTSVTAEARAEAEAAFGKPLAGPGIVPLEQSAQTEDLVAARKTGDLRKVISVLMGNNK